MCLRRAPEKYIAGAALDRAALKCLGIAARVLVLQVENHCSEGKKRA
jgi:hypothetical protein